MRVLLVEDDPDVSETITCLLENFYSPVEIHHITDGDGFRKGTWRVGGWDLVILDLMMPGITGFEVCEKMRSLSATRKVPIIALTGYDTLQNEERIKAAGATGYLAKPFEVPKLLEEIKKVLVRS